MVSLLGNIFLNVSYQGRASRMDAACLAAATLVQPTAGLSSRDPSCKKAGCVHDLFLSPAACGLSVTERNAHPPASTLSWHVLMALTHHVICCRTVTRAHGCSSSCLLSVMAQQTFLSFRTHPNQTHMHMHLTAPAARAREPRGGGAGARGDGGPDARQARGERAQDPGCVPRVRCSPYFDPRVFGWGWCNLHWSLLFSRAVVSAVLAGRGNAVIGRKQMGQVQ